MSYRARLTAPYLKVSVIEYIDKGLGFESQGELLRASKSTRETYSIPSDKLLSYPNSNVSRIRFSFDQITSVDRIAIEGIKQLTGLSYILRDDLGAAIIAETVISPVDDNKHADLLIRLDAPSSSTYFDLDIIGIAEPLQIEGFFIGLESWIPELNYIYGASYSDLPQVSVVPTGGGRSLRLIDESRSRQIRFETMTQADYKSFRNFYKNKLVGGFCLFEQSQTTQDDWYLSIITPSTFNHDFYDRLSMSLTIDEVNSCQ